MEDYLLVTKDLTKIYKETTAADRVNIHIKKGSIYGLIGKNGAGKTTIMKMIAGLAKPTSGSFEYTGFNCTENEAFSRIGALIEAPAIDPNLTGFDNIRIKCLAFGIGDKKYINDLLELVGLSASWKKKAGKYSLGQKQRLGIALALVGDPDFLILDEPINGLDPQGIAEVREMFNKLNQERKITILISSHILEELSKIATDYAIIDGGRIVEESTNKELKEKCRDKIAIKTGDVAKAIPVIDGLGFKDYSVVNDKTIHVFDRLSEITVLNMELAKAQIPVESIGIESSDLEEYFLKVTGTIPGERR
ncbi:MAG: ATP-binding cassette domain-containing protein [Clostridiales bacterium]|jgi:ABC-2 type transport system ATP-binding protein|nr:ATP-binding cassette domain-containing protein [Clostridiales bacterium]MBR4495166.1 ATP-binding cassette domain-containing protein [Clostridiales bacterium]